MPVKLQNVSDDDEARIEVIPLIDIMFFLLAAFMLVSLSMTQLKRVPINLPAASAGIATLFSDAGDVSAVQLVTSGATILGAGGASGSPPQTTGAWVFGAFAGVGASAFVTNARTPSDFSGPSSAWTFNAGAIPAFSIQFAMNSSGIYQFSVSPPRAGIGFGSSLSFFSQNTILTSNRSVSFIP